MSKTKEEIKCEICGMNHGNIENNIHNIKEKLKASSEQINILKNKLNTLK